MKTDGVLMALIDPVQNQPLGTQVVVRRESVMHSSGAISGSLPERGVWLRYRTRAAWREVVTMALGEDLGFADSQSRSRPFCQVRDCGLWTSQVATWALSFLI